MNFVNTIKVLKKDVQIYKFDNDRIMKSKEEKDGLNIKLIHSLDRIQKNIDKKNDSIKSRRHRYHDEGRKTRSVGRNHHHSPRHSSRRARSSSILSPIMKHKRRYEVDELQGEMNKIKPPTFDGEHKKDEDVETWKLSMRKYFQLNNYSSWIEGRISIYQLKGKASIWWD